jgi:hypothetical protein
MIPTVTPMANMRCPCVIVMQLRDDPPECISLPVGIVGSPYTFVPMLASPGAVNSRGEPYSPVRLHSLAGVLVLG